MPAGRIPIKTYSSEELRLLAAEGRLKGRGIEGLVNLRPDQKARDREVSIETFALAATRMPCWNTPSDLLRTFVELVQIPSPPGSEEDVADYLEKRLLVFGFEDLQRDSFGNLRATLPATDDTAPNLLFTAHMDCVYPGNGTVVRPVFCASGEIRTDGGNSLGADDKAGIASILSTLDYLHNAKLAHGEIRVLFTVQEELGYRGVKQVRASILNSIHLVVSMDPPVRVGRDETAHLAVLHMPPAHPFVHLVRQAAQDCGIEPTLLFAEDGYVGGDTICLSPLGAHVVDFCSCSRYPHTAHEHLRIRDLFDQTNWMIATVERMLSYDPSGLELRAVYGEEPIGNLTGVRKQVPLTEDLLKEKVDLARHIHAKPGPKMVPALMHLSAITPRIGDPKLLMSVVEAYDRCIRLDQVPQVLRDLSVSLLHFVSNLADVRPLEALIPRAQEVVERGGDESAQVNALRFLEEIFQKERRVVVKARIIRIMILSMQSNSQVVVDRLTEFLRGNLDETIHALTVAFCNRKRGAWERASASGKSRIVGGRSRGKQEHTGWTTVRQRILQLLLEEDRILPEMMEWIFTHDGVATQRIAVGFIDPNKTSKITTLILQNLKSRERGVQETAVHFVGAHRMVPAVGALIDLLMTPYLCRNRSLVEWALDAIGPAALAEIIGRLGGESDYAGFVRRMFDRHDSATDVEFTRLENRLQGVYGSTFQVDDPSQLAMLGHYIGRKELRELSDLSRWDKRRTIVFYDQMRELYGNLGEMERLADLVEGAAEGSRNHFIQMAIQKNVFDDPDFMTLVAKENPKFLEHFVWLERQFSRHALLLRLREFMAGSPVDMTDTQDVEIYYLYLLKQSTKMPDRSLYLEHIEEARLHLFPPLRPYCRPFTITGDRIEEVGTVDRGRIKSLVADLPQVEQREARLRHLLTENVLAKRECQRLINSLAETLGVDVSSHNSLEARTEALLGEIDFEFDSAYRPVPQVVFPNLLRVRMKHKNDAIVALLADYAIEYVLVNHTEIRDVFSSGELDLILDNLNDLLTDRVYEAERELSEDVYEELHNKHIKALSQFYEIQWKGIIRQLKKHCPEGRLAELVEATEKAMLEYDIRDEDQADLLDTNLDRLVRTLRVADAELMSFHRRHRECYKVYAAVLRARNIRQLKRIYKEVYLLLQDEISFSSVEHPPENKRRGAQLPTGDVEEDSSNRTVAGPGYLKYARKELGKLGKLMSDFVLEKALAEKVSIVQTEITKLRQIVVGTSQILCVPVKDVSIIYRSWPGNDCNKGDIQQVLSPDCSFFKIISDGSWKGYFTLVEVRKRNERALLVDVLNYSGLRMENENFIKVLMHHIIKTAQAEGMHYVTTSSYENHLSNRDYIRRAFRKAFPALGTVQQFGLINTPKASFQSLVPNLNVIWRNPEPSVGVERLKRSSDSGGRQA